ncbi:MAG: DUF5005 domain-containing protein [Bacteroidetes bacterium]|nr:DUF5005 domain-containing protein [Bacteroidota bacterium]
MIHKHLRLFAILFFQVCIVSSSIAQGIPDSTFNTLLRTENGGWVAGDATYSLELPDGRTLWLFGDSFIGTVNPDSSLAPGASMIRNCAVLQSGDTMTALYQGTFNDPIDFVETNTPDSTWYWPEHGIVEDDTLKIVFSEFGTNGGTSGWNFEYRNAYVVSFTYPEIEFVEQIQLPYFELNGVMYGDRIMNFDDYTYIYGRKEENPSNNIPSVHLARSNVGDLLGDWEFYDGNNWFAEPEVSKKLTDHPVSQQFGVFQHQDKFVMITQEIWLGTKIYSLVANQPEGPWSNVTVLYETPYPFPDMLTYNAYPHPQFDENNELLISYNSNGDFWQLFNNIELYRPNFFRIPYTTIHPSFTPTNVSQIADSDLLELKCYPNPAHGMITFSFTLQENNYIDIQIHNLQGVNVMTKSVGRLTKGIHRIEVEMNELAAGAYVYHILDTKGVFLTN